MDENTLKKKLKIMKVVTSEWKSIGEETQEWGDIRQKTAVYHFV